MYPFRTAGAVFFSLALTAAAAQDLPVPASAEAVLLTISGLNQADYPSGSVAFTMDGLKAMGLAEIETSSIWTNGTHRYTGVLLRSVIQTLQIKGSALRLHALNDYAIDMPVQDATEMGPLLAYLMDDQPMSVRDKGPIWAIYPYDAGPDFRSDETFSRSVWQLDRIEVVP